MHSKVRLICPAGLLSPISFFLSESVCRWSTLCSDYIQRLAYVLLQLNLTASESPRSGCKSMRLTNTSGTHLLARSLATIDRLTYREAKCLTIPHKPYA